eukprot:767915-Hanusia_phi.AAC.3
MMRRRIVLRQPATQGAWPQCSTMILPYRSTHGTVPYCTVTSMIGPMIYYHSIPAVSNQGTPLPRGLQCRGARWRGGARSGRVGGGTPAPPLSARPGRRDVTGCASEFRRESYIKSLSGAGNSGTVE